MSDVIRNAVIKLAIQLQTPNLKTPALDSAVKVQTELNQATKEATSVNTAAAAAAGKLNITIDASSIAAKKSTETWQQYSARVQEAISQQSGLANATDKVTAAAQRHQSYSEVAISSNEQLAKAQRELNTTLAEGTEGALMLGRGFAFLTMSQDSDLKKAVQLVAIFQGGADVFKGTVKIINAATKSFEALSVTQKAAATSTTVSGGAVAAATSGLMALNPVVVGATAAVAAGAVAWKLYTNSVQAAVEKEQQAADAYKRAYEIRLEANRKLASAASSNFSIDERILDLEPSAGGKLARTRNLLNANDKALREARQQASTPPLDYSHAWAAAYQRGSGDPGSDAEKVVAEQQATYTSANENLSSLLEQRVELLRRERDLQAENIRLEQQRLSNLLSNPDMQFSRAGENVSRREVEIAAANMGQDADEIISLYSDTMQRLLEEVKRQNEKVRSLEGEAMRARRALYNPNIK